MSTQLTKQDLYDMLYPISAAKYFGVNDSSYLAQHVKDTATMLHGILYPNEVVDIPAPIVRIPSREMLLDQLEMRLNENLIEPYVKVKVYYTPLDKKGPFVHLTLTTFDDKGAYDFLFLKKFNIPANFQLKGEGFHYPDTELFEKTLTMCLEKISNETTGLIKVR